VLHQTRAHRVAEVMGEEIVNFQLVLASSAMILVYAPTVREFALVITIALVFQLGILGPNVKPQVAKAQLIAPVA
jgi:hypothetical protein